MIDDLVEMQTFLAGDADIEAFCQNEFAKSCCVFLGFDDEDLPNEEDCPFVQIVGNINQLIGKNKSGGKVFVSVCVSNKDINTDGNKKTYSGSVQVSQLAEIVAKKILAEQGFVGLIEKIESSSERKMPTPLHGVAIVITYKEIFSSKGY